MTEQKKMGFSDIQTPPPKAEGPGVRVLIIDDDEGMCYTISRMAREKGYEAAHAQTLQKGLDLAFSRSFDVVFLDVRLPDGDGLSAVPKLQALPGAPEIIIITGYSDKDGAKTALKSGVWDYIEKPARINTLKLSLVRALKYRNQKKSLESPLSVNRCGIIGHSPRLLMCLALVSQAARSRANVLIAGETGTGKELFARAIHSNGPRAQKPFVVVDCAALPQNLAESVLFGHVKGAFTGAEKAASGLIRKAHGGTLFLDEVGELPLGMQKTFLRVLQEKNVLPVGGAEEVKSDFRLVSATNRDLEAEVERGVFRKDLYFRLKGLMIELPPLRRRPKDIRKMVLARVAENGREAGHGLKTVSEAFFTTLNQYRWPGNVRELFNAVDSALSMEPDCPTLYPKHIPEYIRRSALNPDPGAGPDPAGTSPARDPDPLVSLKAFRQTAIEEAERRYLAHLMEVSRGDVEKACKIAKLKRARLYQLMKKYEIGR